MNFIINYRFKPNTIYCGDNLKILSHFPNDCIDLIYIDPPFFSNEIYEIIWNDGYEIEVFEDRWSGGIQHYLQWMKPRIEQLYRILKNNGSFYLHCDWHSNSYLRVLCDEIFGYKNLRAEIIWKRTTASKYTSNTLGRNTDTILYYTKSDEYTFNKILIPLNKEQIKRDYNLIEKETGRRFTHNKMIKRGKSPKKIIFKDKGEMIAPNGKRFVWNQETYNKKIKDNPYVIYWTKNNNPRIKNYLDEHKGIPLTNIWLDISPLASNSKERLGYPTQKPEALLERIIKLSSNKGDTLLDSYCGCGSFISMAKKLKRKFIGIDVSPLACKIMAKRLSYKLEDIIGMKFTLEELKQLNPFHFQKWAVERIGGIPSKRKTSDMGIDGLISQNEFGDNLPIEVKQHNISRPIIDKFETVLRRTKKKFGYVIGFDCSKGAIEEIARCKNEDDLIIKMIYIKDLIK